MMRIQFHIFALRGFAVASGLFSGALVCGAEDSQDAWRSHVETLAADPSVLRLYPFDEGAGALAANVAGDKAGALVLPIISPYGLYRGIPHSPAPEPADCPRWTTGRWPWKKALECGLAERQVCRSLFYGTTNGVFTVEAWIRVHEVGERVWVGGDLLGVGLGWGSGWRIAAERQHWCPDGNVAFAFGTPNGTANTRIPFLPFGTWHYLAAAWDGQQIRLQVDDQSASAPCTGPFIPSQKPKELENDVAGLAIGGHLPGREGGLRFDIDELVIYDRALSPEELTGHFKRLQPAESAAEQLARHRKATAQRAELEQIDFQFPLGSGGYFPIGRPVVAAVRIPKMPSLTTLVSARMTVNTREDGKTVYRKEVPLHATEGSSSTAEFSFAGDRCDLYSAVLSLHDASGHTVLEKAFLLGLTLPHSGGSLRKESFILGVHQSAYPQPEAKAIGATWCRVTLDWGKIELKKGIYSWEEADRIMGAASASRLNVLCCVTGWPGWLQLDPAKTVQPSDLAAYGGFLRLLSQRFRREIAAWEIWNAPDGPPAFTFRGNDGSAAYAAFVETAANVLRKEAPGTRLIGGGFSADALKRLDGVSCQESPAATASDKITPCAGCAEGGRPCWNTASAALQPAERMGLLAPDAFEALYPGRLLAAGEFKAVMVWPYFLFSGRGSAVRHVRQMIVEQAAGTKAVFLSAGVNEYYPFWNTSDGAPSEKGIAIAALMAMLSDARSVTQSDSQGLPLSAYRIAKDGAKSVWVLWTDRKRQVAARFQKKGDFQAFDWLGNPILFQPSDSNGNVRVWLDESPLYVETAADVRFSELP